MNIQLGPFKNAVLIECKYGERIFIQGPEGRILEVAFSPGITHITSSDNVTIHPEYSPISDDINIIFKKTDSEVSPTA